MTFGGDLNKMEIFELIHRFEWGIYLVVLIDLVISILILNSQSAKVKNFKKIMNKFYGFIEIAFQGVKKCGVLMKHFHLWLDSFYHRIPEGVKNSGVLMKHFHLWLDRFYHRIPEGVKNSGNVIRKFHTGKININLLYFVISIFLSIILIILVS